jgi:SPFH domain / Band 7 family
MKDERDTKPPIVYRLLHTVGRPFGLRWVGDNKVAVVYRLELYSHLGGPGFFWINPFTQSVRYVIDTAPDFVPVAAPGIQTRDGLQLDLTMALAYSFDPAIMPPERAAVFVTWTRDTHRAIIQDSAKRALQGVVPSFFAEEICQGGVFDRIEQRLMEELSRRLRPLALRPQICFVLHVGVPPKLRDRFEAVVQRRINIEDLGQYASYELIQALRTEAIESLKSMGGARQYINLPDLSSMVTPSQHESQSSPRRIVPPAAPSDQEAAEPPPPDTYHEPPKRQPKSRLG